jgi:hypothetical protein
VVEPGTCSLIPSEESVVVSGLGDGVMVNASVTPHYSFENTQLLLNGFDTVQPVLVTNGDKLRVLVCAPVQFGFNETFIMEYGHNADTITVVT